MLSTTELEFTRRLILPADVFIVSQQSFTTEFTSDGIHQSETVHYLGSIRKEEEEDHFQVNIILISSPKR